VRALSLALLVPSGARDRNFFFEDRVPVLLAPAGTTGFRLLDKPRTVVRPLLGKNDLEVNGAGFLGGPE
jgi:hypothetical protein